MNGRWLRVPKWFMLGLLVTALALVAAACGGEDTTVPPTAAAPAGPDAYTGGRNSHHVGPAPVHHRRSGRYRNPGRDVRGRRSADSRERGGRGGS